MRAPTNSPAAWCDWRIPLNIACAASLDSVVVGDAAVVTGTETDGGTVTAVVGGELVGATVGATVLLGVAESSLEHATVASRSVAAAAIAAEWVTRRRGDWWLVVVCVFITEMCAEPARHVVGQSDR